MEKLAVVLIRTLIEDGCEINVECEGELDLEMSTETADVVEVVEAVDCLSHIIAYKNGKRVATFLVSLDDDFEPEETVIDYFVNKYSDTMYELALQG